MILVLDASSAIEIALHKEFGATCRKFLKAADLVLAPDIFPSEITNVFWKYAVFSDMPGAICQKGIEYCLDLVDDYIDTKPLCHEVFSESVKNEHASYDLFYLIVARRYDAAILTRDKKMLKTARRLNISVLNTESEKNQE